MSIMKNGCWVIKVTYLKYKQININEAYWTLDKCMWAIRKKLENKKFIGIDEYTYRDLDDDIIYEAKLVDIFE